MVYVQILLLLLFAKYYYFQNSVYLNVYPGEISNPIDFHCKCITVNAIFLCFYKVEMIFCVNGPDVTDAGSCIDPIHFL